MLGSRLQTVADFVPRGSVIADIGTDHGYLPIELIKSGKCTKAVAADVNEGPLFAAKRLFLSRVPAADGGGAACGISARGN